MNKAEFIEALSSHYDGSKADAAKALNAVVRTITYQTASGEKVSITGFGVFEKVPRPARMVRNPRTGERKRAKATAVPRFRAGSDLKAYVSGAKKVPKVTAKKATTASKSAEPAAKAPAKTAAAKAAPAKAATAKATAKAPAARKTTATKAAPAAKKSAATTAAKRSTAKTAPTKTAARKSSAATAKSTAKKAPAKKTAKS